MIQMNSDSKWYFYSFILYQIHFVVTSFLQQIVFSQINRYTLVPSGKLT